MRLVAVVALLTLGCPGPRPPIPDVPEGPVGCQTACARQRALGCRLGAPTPEGSTCVQICENSEDGPPVLRWDVACLTHAMECGACR